QIIKKTKFKIVFDPMYGAGRGYLDRILKSYGYEVEVLHGWRDVLFGGDNPEPEDSRLEELKSRVVESKANLGLANDGDADRFGIVDEKGVFYSANMIIPLLIDYLVKERGFKGSVVRSVATSHLIDRVAAKHEITVHETPVGFKHIAKIMLAEPVIIGGEESGGLSIKGHIPEKDGILACLLVVEMLAKRQKPLSQLWAELIAKVGPVVNTRYNLELKEEEKQAFMKLLREETPTELSNLKIKSVNKIDGVKLTLADGSWVLARPSGTEPIVRVYVESNKAEKVAAIYDAVQRLI
ncbi:MAG: phosphoglucomutase/phosphomannomutase family protein, partial [bacterium]